MAENKPDGFETDVDGQRDSAHYTRSEHLIIVVPGIRDRGGDWGLVRDELVTAGFAVAVITWNEYFGIPRFLVPAPWFRRRAMRELEERIWDSVHEYTRGRKPPKISFIAHSFGSYILCYLLRRQHLLEVNRIILCGSVLHRKFRFSKFSTRFCGPIINDVGTRDRWPFIASCVTFGYGTIGTYGYMNAPVIDRFHEGMDHGGFTDPTFCRNWWAPFLTGASTTVQTPSPNLPVKESALRKSGNSILQKIKWLVVLAMLILIIHFLPRLLPCKWQFALGLRDLPCTLNISIQRTVDMSKTGCRDGKRHYYIKNDDVLTFSDAPGYYALQAHLPASGNLKIVDGRGSEIIPNKTTRLLSESGWLRTTQRVHFSGKTLKLRYLYEGDTTPNDNEWGFAIVSTLPIVAITADATLPIGKSVSEMNHNKAADNSAFTGCVFDAGTTPRLVCNKPLNNEANLPQYLYWNWNVFEKC
jgi:hypothetical protein